MYNLQAMLERIKIEKKKKGFTNETLSVKTQIPIGTLSKVLAGITKEPPITTIIKIALALEVSTDYLIFGSEPFSTELSQKHTLVHKYSKLHSIDQTKVDTYIDDLLENRKYTDNNSGGNIKYFIGHNAAFGGGASTVIQSEDDKRKFYEDLEAAKEENQ